jgi:hypothetical protein
MIEFNHQLQVLMQSDQIRSAHPSPSLCTFALPCMSIFSYINEEVSKGGQAGAAGANHDTTNYIVHDVLLACCIHVYIIMSLS